MTATAHLKGSANERDGDSLPRRKVCRCVEIGKLTPEYPAQGRPISDRPIDRPSPAK